MRVFRALVACLVVALVASSCQRTVERDILLDDLVYGIDTTVVYSSSSEKTRLKTESQFMATAYANLYLQPISAEILNDFSLIRLSHGDKGMIAEMILEYFVADPVAQATMPDETAMWADLDAFLDETYLRFFQRLPSAYERVSLQRLIEDDSDTRPIDVYRAFLLANEYLYY